mgnify:CR=1 FL=1
MRITKLKKVVASVIVAVAVLAVLFAVLGVSRAADSLKDSKEGGNMEQAIVAGGCFWCMEADFKKIPGVKEVVSGYIGGTGKNPTYEDYAEKGYIEAVRISYDPSVIPYEKLLDQFWLHIDATDAGGQFCDRGHAYTTAIFYGTAEQKRLAEQSKTALERSGQLKKPVVTKIIKAGEFYPAEDYHQDYYQENPIRYKFYRFNCGRDSRLKELWGDKTEAVGALGKTPKYTKPTQKELKE